MNITEDTKRQLKGVSAVLFYFTASISKEIIFKPIEHWNGALLNFLTIIYSFLIILTLGYFMKDFIISSYQDLKKNHLVYFKKYLKYWFLILILMMSSNLIIHSFIGDIAANESLIRELFEKSPIFIYISAVFVAPFLEELVFRAGFYHIFKNKYVFIFMSGFTFGAIHVLPGLENLIELLYIIPYSIPGFVFAYVLAKSKNIFVPMGLHFIHNGVLMSLQTLVMILS